MRKLLAALALATLVALFSALPCRAEEKPPLRLRSVAFSPDGKAVLAATGDLKEAGTITVWDLGSGKRRWSRSEKVGLPDLALTPDGQTLAVGAYDSTVKLFDAATGEPKGTLRHPREVQAVAFSGDGKQLATACSDEKVRIWDVAAGVEKTRFTGPHGQGICLDFSRDGKWLLVAEGEEGVKLWDVAAGEVKETWKHGSFYTPFGRLTPDGGWAITGGYEGTVRLWDRAARQQRARFSGTGGVHALAFSPASETLAVCGFSREITLFGLTFREPTTQEKQRIQTLLTRLDDNSYDVREGAGADLLKIGFIAESALREAAIDSESAEVRIRARRIRQEMLNQPRAPLRGHTGEVEAIAFSPDGKLLASGGKDGTVRVWDVAAAKEIACLRPSRD